MVTLPHQDQKQGLAHGELLILIGIVVLLTSIILPGLNYKRQTALNDQCKEDIFHLLQAGQKYYADYENWPSPYTGEYGDYRFGHDIPNAEVVNILRGVDGPGNDNHVSNPRKIDYFPSSLRSQVTESGELLDVWGRPYHIVIDTDLNNTCYIDRSTYKSQIGHGMLIWSDGPDGIPESDDDILSWEVNRVK